MSVIQRNDPNIKISFEKSVENFIMQNFKDWKHFSVTAEIRRYKASEQADIAYQVGNKIPRRVEVYFNGEYLLDITEGMSHGEALAGIHYRLLVHFGGGREAHSGQPVKIYT